MTRTRFLAVSLIAALAIAAVAAADAMAFETEWMLEDKSLSELKVEKVGVAFSGGAFSILVPSKKITLECKKVEGTGTLLKGAGDTLSLTLGECKTTSGCKVSAPITLKAKTTLIQVAGEMYYERLEPQETGQPLATFKYISEGCALPLESKLTGNVAAEPLSDESIEQGLNFSETISVTANKELKEEKATELSLKVNEAEAFLSGKLKMITSGEFATQQAARNMFHGYLCTAKQGVCVGLARIGPPATLKMEAETEALFTFGAFSTTCTTSKWEGATTAGIPNIIGNFSVATFTGCTGSCSVSVVNTPPEFRIHPITPERSGNGRINLWNWQLSFICGATTCVFKLKTEPPNPPFYIQGGGPAKFSSPPIGMDWVSGMGCPGTGTWKSTGGGGVIFYKFTTPNPVFVTFA